MTLMEIILDIRRKFDNNSLISVNEYKDILLFLKNNTRQHLTKDLIVHNKKLCMYKTFVLRVIKNSINSIRFIIKDNDSGVEYSYLISNK